MITVSVFRAVAAVGSRNAFTPLLTASTPVMAVHPLAKAFSSSQADTAAVAAAGAGGEITGAGCPPPRIVFPTPMTIAISSVPTNRYVGARNTAPVSRTPRRFTSAITARIPRHIPSVCGCRAGTAETRAPTPAEIPTATTKT